MAFLAALNGALARLILGIAGACLVAMVLVVAWAVFGRFVLNDTPSWAEALALLLLGWVALGAAAAGVREGFHMGFETLRDQLPAPLQRGCLLVSDLVVLGFGAAMAWFGWDLAAGVWTARLPTLGLPGSVEYAPIVLGGVLITLFGLEHLLRRLAGLPPVAAAPDAALISDA